MKFRYKLIFEIVWSDNKWVLPMNRIRNGKSFIGYTNKFENFTYRLKPKFIKNEN